MPAIEARAMEPSVELLTRAARGERCAFDALFARALPRLRWYIDLRLRHDLRARLEPGDVVQETYAAALPLLAAFDAHGEGAFVRWLMAIAENQLRRLAAHHGAHHRRAMHGGGPADAALALALDPESGPCTRAARSELRERVQVILGRLDEVERDALAQRVLQGRPLADVATALARSESSVRRLVAAALEKLGRALREERFDV